MVRKKEVIVKYWLENLIKLKQQTDEHSLENLLKIQGSMIVGVDANEFVEEAITAIYYFAQEGYINIVSENETAFTYWGIQKNNCHFRFTNKFDELTKQVTIEKSQLPKTPFSGLPSVHTLIVNSGTIGKIAGNDINSISHKGDGDNNINSPQYHFHSEDKKKHIQTLRLQLKKFLDANLRISGQIKKKMSLPLVERFDIYKAEQLEDEILMLLPEIYSQFHDLRLALVEGNKIIETAYTEYTRPAPPQFANQGRGHIGQYWLNELRNHINQKIKGVCMKILGSVQVVSEDELHI